MTARQMTLAILDGKQPTPTRKQEIDVQAAILAAMRNHDEKGVEPVAGAPRSRLIIIDK